jgi:hypothetical protein
MLPSEGWRSLLAVSKTSKHVRFQVLTAASTKMRAFWNIAPCSLVEVDRRFRGRKYLNVVSICIMKIQAQLRNLFTEQNTIKCFKCIPYVRVGTLLYSKSEYNFSVDF